MLVPRSPSEPYIPRITPLIWVSPEGGDPPTLQIDTCLDVAYQLRRCFGPRGLPKHLAFRFLRGLSAPPAHVPDTASVLACMQPAHPAARALASAAAAQAREVGDGAALVLLLGAGLLERARALLELGLTAREVEDGYRLACGRALELLDGDGELACSALGDLRDERDVAGVLRVLLSTRVPDMADMLAEAVARCCVQSWTSKGGNLTFDPDSIQIIKNITEGRPGQTSEEQSCRQEESEEDASREETTTRQHLRGEVEQVTDERKESSGEEGDWGERDLKDKDNKSKSDLRSDAKQVCAGVTGGRNKQQELVDEFLRSYAGRSQGETLPRNGAQECQQGVCREPEPDDDWEILSLALEEVRLESEGADRGVGRWQREESLPEERRAQGRRREWGRTQAERRGGAALKRSRAAGERLCRSLVQLGKKHLVLRGRGAEVKGHGRVRMLHRLMGRLRRRSAPYGKGQHPANTCGNKRNPRPAKPIQASVAWQHTPGQRSQGVTITLHGPDRELLDSCEAAIQACLRLYGCMRSDPRLVPGAGACEAALSTRLCRYGLTLPGLEQMAVHGFAQAVLAPVRALGENRGAPGDVAVVRLHEALRRRGRGRGPRGGLDTGGVLEPLVCKSSALKKATKAALSVMSDLLSDSPGERGTETKSPEFPPAQRPGHQSLQQP